MTDTATERTGGRSAGRFGWSFASGRIAALEPALLTRSFFEDLIKARDHSAARTALGKTRYARALSSNEALENYPHTVAECFEDMVAQVREEAPAHPMWRFLELPASYRAFRSVFLRKSDFKDSLAELSDSFDMLAYGRDEAAALSRHISMLADREGPQQADSVSRTLFLDSCAVTLMFHIAAAAPEPAVAGVLSDISALRAWSAVLRSLWNNTAAEKVLRWFALPPLQAGIVKDTLSLAEVNPAGGVTPFLTPAAAGVLRAFEPERIRDDIDQAAGEAVRRSVIDSRNVPFGPERVLAYVLALEVEATNLKIALSAAVSGVDPEHALKRLRSEYA